MATINLGVLFTHRKDYEEQIISACLRHRCGTIYLPVGSECDQELFHRAGLSTQEFDPCQTDPSFIQGNTALLFATEDQLHQAEKGLKKLGIPTIRH